MSKTCSTCNNGYPNWTNIRKDAARTIDFATCCRNCQLNLSNSLLTPKSERCPKCKDGYMGHNINYDPIKKAEITFRFCWRCGRNWTIIQKDKDLASTGIFYS